MVDDSKYIIVPNREISGSNSQGEEVARLFKEGWKIKHTASNRDSVHYLLVKFKQSEEK